MTNSEIEQIEVKVIYGLFFYTKKLVRCKKVLLHVLVIYKNVHLILKK